jgi:hypothetical protein
LPTCTLGPPSPGLGAYLLTAGMMLLTLTGSGHGVERREHNCKAVYNKHGRENRLAGIP